VGVGGSDRVTLVRADGAITNQWLEVTVKPTQRTGLTTADVFYFGNLIGESSDGNVVDGHHVVEVARPAVGVVPIGDDSRPLLRPRRDPEAAAARELLEETGPAAQPFELGRLPPSNGLSNQTVHFCLARGLRRVSDRFDTNEVMSVRWFEADAVRSLLRRNEIRDGVSLTGLPWYFARLAGLLSEDQTTPAGSISAFRRRHDQAGKKNSRGVNVAFNQVARPPKMYRVFHEPQLRVKPPSGRPGCGSRARAGTPGAG
jgi:8-oxo-dGTP pyrophosphatase MutT (NUDIX family)